MSDATAPIDSPGMGPPGVEQPAAVPAAGEVDSAATDAAEVEVTLPRFAQLVDSGGIAEDTSIHRFYDINIKVSAELGSVTLPIGELLELGEGSVIKLNRSVSSPVDVIANGIRVARGEVVVVDDCFAVRIKEIDRTARKGS